MKIKKTFAISGASGFIGSYLAKYFEDKGHRVIELHRSNFEPHHEKQLSLLLSQVDVIINLAGAPVNKRWTEKYKLELYESRINTTRSIVNAINAASKKPKLLISASAIGYYSTLHSYDEYITRKGDDFLANLCDQWEGEARKVTKEVRLIIPRLGIVLAQQGGAFSKMAFSSKMKISAIIGSGNQAFNWIDIKDVVNIIDTIIEDNKLDGVINFVAPNRITNRELVKSLSRKYKSVFTIKIPEFCFKILLGEASSIMTKGQRVKPTKLLEYGYKFKTTTIEQFLK